MDDAISILLFCHSLNSRLRLLLRNLRLMKVHLEFGHPDKLHEIVCLVGLGMDLMVLRYTCDENESRAEWKCLHPFQHDQYFHNNHFVDLWPSILRP
jgi:hypothetical protein